MAAHQRRVLAGILATGILDDEQQDRLANELLWPDKARYVHPLGWFGSTFIEFDLSPSRRAPRQRKARDDPNTPAADDSDATIRAWGRALHPEVDPQTSLFD
jgi:hypothetical protein